MMSRPKDKERERKISVVKSKAEESPLVNRRTDRQTGYTGRPVRRYVFVNPFFLSLCPNILESDTQLRCREGPAEGTMQSCLPDPSVLEILQTYNGCLNYRPPFPPLGFSPMALIQNGLLSPRYPFKLGTKPAVSLPDLLTPHRVLCASVSNLAGLSVSYLREDPCPSHPAQIGPATRSH